MPDTGQLFIISGPSGVGKGTLVGAVLKQVPCIETSVSATTRAMRAGDVDGIDYHFLSDEQFDRLLAENGFLEWAKVHDSRYGTLFSEVNRILAANKDIILEIDPQGCAQVLAKCPDAFTIFIAPPSMRVLEKRLRQRATEDETTIRRRLDAAKLELDAKDGYNVVIVNDDLTAATQELVKILDKRNKRECT